MGIGFKVQVSSFFFLMMISFFLYAKKNYIRK